MSVLIHNTFDSGVTTAFAGLLQDWLRGLGQSATVVEQATKDVQVAQEVVVSCTELEEVVYQSGTYRAGMELTVKVDRTTGTVQQFRDLGAATLDFLQLDDLAAQLTAQRDATNRGYCVVAGTVINQSRMEDVGDDTWRKVFVVDVFGCNPLAG